MISLVAILSFFTAAFVGLMVRKAAILDHPNARSSHLRPTPRAGGLGVLAGIGAGLVYAQISGLSVSSQGLALAALGFGILGLADDLLALGSRLKFSLMTFMAAGLVGLVGPVASIGITADWLLTLPWMIGFAGSVLWIFVVANAVNFMDGSDGLIVAAIIPAGLGLFFIGDGSVSITGLALSAALVGFAIWNVPRAVLFLGDVGSLAIGGLFALVALESIQTAWDVWIYPLLILPVLADVLLTLVGKVRNGIGFLAPHRTHAYQLLVRMGWEHWKVAAVYLMASSLCAATAVLTHSVSGPAPFIAFIVWVMFLTIGHIVVRKKARSAGLDLTS